MAISSIETIPRDPAEWTYAHAVSAASTDADATARNKSSALYMAGKGWQPDLWMGPGYNSAGNLETATRDRIHRQFVGVPEASKCVGRRVNGACGNQADIDILPANPAGEVQEDGSKQPSKEQEAYRAQWKRDHGLWWDRKGYWGGTDLARPTGVRCVAANASAHSSGSACIRFFFNPASRTVERKDANGVVVDRQIPRQKDRAAALEHIEFVAPHPDACFVYTDPDTLQKTGIFFYTDLDDKRCAEQWFARTVGDRKVTVLRTLREGVEPQDGDEKVYPWGRGRLPIVQADIGCLLTPDVLSQQAALNFEVTATVRLAEAHGYAQRDEINAQPAGEWKMEAPVSSSNLITKVIDGVTWYLHGLDRSLGNGVVVNLVGIEHTVSVDPATNKETVGLTTPIVQYHEPSSPESLITLADASIMLIRDSCHQGHIRKGLGASTAEASGEAYEQSRAEFVSDITGVAEALDGMIAAGAEWLELAAAHLMGDDNPTFLDDWIVRVQSHPNAGAPSTQAQAETRANVAAELLSPEEGIARLNVQDVAGEQARIAAARTLSVEKTRAEIAALWVGLGADFQTAAKRAGLSEKDAAALARTDGPPNLEQ